MSRANNSFKSYYSADPIVKYCSEVTIHPHPLQQKLQKATLEHPSGGMLGAPEVLQMGHNFIQLIRAKKCIDVGTFTGASALAWALAMPADGKVLSLDVTHAALDSIGRPIIDSSEMAGKIDFKLGSALDCLDALIAAGESGTWDFAFIDADKENYTNYYNKCVELLRPGGVIMIDNSLWHGSVVNPEPGTSAQAIDHCNRHVFADSRTNSMLTTTGDGTHVAFKK